MCIETKNGQSAVKLLRWKPNKRSIGVSRAQCRTVSECSKANFASIGVAGEISGCRVGCERPLLFRP